MRRALLLTSFLVLAGAAPAAAQVPAPVMKLDVERNVLAGESWKVSGSISPADAVEVRVSRDGKLVQKRTVPADAAGRFALTLRGRRAGSYRVVAVHYPNPALGYARTSRKPVR